MRIIRDPETAGVMTMGLAITWGFRSCSVEDCNRRVSTIIADPESPIPTYALCEEHFQESNQPEGVTLTVVSGPTGEAIKESDANRTA